jgi:DNA polymerase-3 subunit alpha
LPGFLRKLREQINGHPGETRVEFAFVLEDGVAPVAEASATLTWKVSASSFQELRAHPAVAGVQIQAKPAALKPGRWGKRPF